MAQSRRLIFARPRPRPHRRLALGAVAALGIWLTGCQTTQTQQIAPTELTRTVVVPVTHEHILRFPARADALEGPAEQRFERFLTSIAPQPGDRITLVSTDPETGLPPARLDRLERHIAAITGRRPDVVIAASPAAGASPHDVAVRVQTAVVVPPRCIARASQTDGPPPRAFGCTTQANLAAMVARPLDLIAPSEGGSLDGTVAAAAIDRYRAGERRLPAPPGTD